MKMTENYQKRSLRKKKEKENERKKKNEYPAKISHICDGLFLDVDFCVWYRRRKSIRCLYIIVIVTAKAFSRLDCINDVLNLSEYRIKLRTIIGRIFKFKLRLNFKQSCCSLA
ncbi:hypothetical protein P5V15_003728 [Pogonomyrmex californicus]